VQRNTAYLKRAVLEVLPDVDREVVVLLHVLLRGDLALQLCDQLVADWYRVSPSLPISMSDIPAPLSCLLAETWKAAVSLGTAAAHDGWNVAVWQNTDDCGRTALVERRAAARGAVRARFRRPSMVSVVEGVSCEMKIVESGDITNCGCGGFCGQLDFCENMARASIRERRPHPRHISLGVRCQMSIRHRLVTL
jgi:hypothetical protein